MTRANFRSARVGEIIRASSDHVIVVDERRRDNGRLVLRGTLLGINGQRTPDWGVWFADTGNSREVNWLYGYGVPRLRLLGYGPSKDWHPIRRVRWAKKALESGRRVGVAKDIIAGQARLAAQDGIDLSFLLEGLRRTNHPTALKLALPAIEIRARRRDRWQDTARSALRRYTARLEAH